MKYEPLRWELKRQYPSFQVIQHNIVIDVLGGFSKDESSTVKKLVVHFFFSQKKSVKKVWAFRIPLP